MKKGLSILLTLVMVLGVFASVPFSASAAQSSLTVADGTTTNNRVPTHIYRNYSKAQYIIPASDLAAMAGNQITSLKWYFKNDQKARKVQVILKEVEETAMTGFVNVSAAQKVFDGNWTLDGTKATVTFDTPFYYSGSNLLVTVLDNTGSWENANPAYGTFRADACCDASSDDPIYTAASTGGGSVSGFMPKTTLYYKPATVVNEVITADGSDTNVYLPTNQVYNYGKSQYIVPAQELSMANGKQMTGMRWFFAGDDVMERKLQVILREVWYSTLDELVDASYGTEVFNGTWTVDGKEAFITFDTPYTYEGDNLLVTIMDNTGSFEGGTDEAYGVYRSGASCSTHTDSAAVDVSFTGGSSRYFVPKTAFAISPGYYVPDTGKIGECTWSFDTSAKTLTISGNGSMDTDATTMPYAYFNKDIETIIVRDGVTSVSPNAFSNYHAQTVVLGKDVKTIGENAFKGCTGISQISLPAGLTAICDSAFNGCTALTSISIPAGVTTIGEAAFAYCSGLRELTLSQGLTTLGDYAFYACEELTQVAIPGGVTTFGDGVFEDCYKLRNATLGQGLTTLGDRAFSGCEALSAIALPETLTTIGDYAFYDCSALSAVNIPAGITAIGNYVFYDCDALTEVAIPAAVTTIGDNAFGYCDHLSKITLPKGLTAIGVGAFRACVALTAIEIPAGVTTIGNYAFNRCLALTSVNIPASITSIGISTFYECEALTSVVIPAGVTSIEYAAFEGCSALREVTLPQGLTTIGNDAFYECSALAAIDIPDGVTTIGDYAFYECQSLSAVEISASVTDIGEAAFAWCSALKTLTLHPGLKTVGEYAFYGCPQLLSVTVPRGVESIGGGAFGLYTDENDNDEVLLPSFVLRYSCVDNAAAKQYAQDTGLTTALEHDYTAVVTEPTCTEQGYTTHTCACGDSYVDTYVAPLGAAGGHAFGAWTQTKAPTCTAAGEETRVCSRDASHKETRSVAALGHAFGAWTQTKAPTCTAMGEESRVCARDASHKETREVAAKGHAFGDWTQTKAPTCTTMGEETRVCQRDNSHKETREVPAKGHAFGDWAQTKAPTCTAAGEESRVCARDTSHVETRAVPATGHRYTDVVTAPSAAAVGYTTHTCANCGDKYTDTYTAPTGKQTLKCAAQAKNALKVQWNKVRTASGYQVQISTKGGKKWSTYATIKNNATISYTFKKLAAGNNYKFRVRFYITVDGKNYFSPWSKTIAAQTLLASGTSLTKLTAGSKSFTAQWKQNKTMNGYQVQYSTDKNFQKGVKTITLKNAKILKTGAKKLAAKKVYYVRIRTYKTIAKVNYYSAWSKAAKVKTK